MLVGKILDYDDDNAYTLCICACVYVSIFLMLNNRMKTIFCSYLSVSFKGNYFINIFKALFAHCNLKKIPANNTLMRYREFNQSMNRAIYFISKSELVSQLYKKEEIETLLEESSHIATRRKEASEMLQVSACWLSLSVNLYNVPNVFTLYRLDM